MSTLTRTGRRPARAFLLSALFSLAIVAPLAGQPADQPAGPGPVPGRVLGQAPGNGPQQPGGLQQPGGPGPAGETASGDQQSAGMEVASSGGITLNFVNADVRDVAKAVLGDYLKLNYEIAANTTGTITIQTSKPLSRAQ